MTKGRGLCCALIAVVIFAAVAGNTDMTSMAGGTNYLDSLMTGVSSVVDGDLTASAETQDVSGEDLQTFPSRNESDEELTDIATAIEDMENGAQQASGLLQDDSQQEAIETMAMATDQVASATEKAIAQAEESTLTLDGGEIGTMAMANVNKSVNVRAEADEDSDKVGYLYRDCGGEILERENGWTKLQSGELTGWVKDEYLLFGDEAEAMASDVGNLIVTIEADALRVRTGPSEDAGVLGVIAKDDELDVIEEMDGWISVQYGSQTGYVSEEFVNADFHVDCGETVEVVEERERKAAEQKAAQEKKAAEQKIAQQKAAQQPLVTENRGAVAADVSDAYLLGALIQCEAGNQPYEGQLAVGAVVMNRVKSGGYPNSMQGVIYASGQFGPAMTGKLDKVLASGNVKASCLQAANEAIAGSSNVGGATHFNRAGKKDGIVIGAHVFW